MPSRCHRPEHRTHPKGQFGRVSITWLCWSRTSRSSSRVGAGGSARALVQQCLGVDGRQPTSSNQFSGNDSLLGKLLPHSIKVSPGRDEERWLAGVNGRGERLAGDGRDRVLVLVNDHAVRWRQGGWLGHTPVGAVRYTLSIRYRTAGDEIVRLNAAAPRVGICYPANCSANE